MGRAVRVDYPGAIHHVVTRGVNRGAVFLDDEDRRDFLRVLQVGRQKLGYGILAYCLMGNHVHLAVRTGRQTLSRAMGLLLGTYARAFNEKHGRTGHLFQGRYGAFLIQADLYLLALIRYIHANPVRARLVQRPEDYPWSSDCWYRAGRGPDWLEVDPVLSMLGATRTVAAEMYRGLWEIDEPPELPPAHASVVRGSRGFAVGQLTTAKKPVVLGDLTVAEVARAVARSEGIDFTTLRTRGKQPCAVGARALTAVVANDVGRISFAATARYFGIAPSSMTRCVETLRSRIPAERFQACLQRIREALVGNAKSVG